ncbi:MAG TPA: ESX secretion-associated protein EspG [Pseudonocardia sp.]|nr:ESX secretion-associated protein EspG [Pseudonocardia sp.]
MSEPTGDEVRLTAIEADACWELLGLGDTPLTLALPSPGRTPVERRALLTAVRNALHDRGLSDDHGPGEQIARSLRLLAGPDHHIDLILVGEPYRHIVAIGAVRRDSAVVAYRRGDLVRLVPVRRGSVVAHLMTTVGPLRPGPGRPVNVPTEVFDAAAAAASTGTGTGTGGSLWVMADELIARGVPRADATSWVHMCTGIRAVGQFGTALWPEGRHRLGPWVIGFHATASGHFLQLRRPDPGGHGATVTVCPLSGRRLASLVAELVECGQGT